MWCVICGAYVLVCRRKIVRYVALVNLNVEEGVDGRERDGVYNIKCLSD